MSIQLLPLEISSQIAAGEIIQRPSSVVKELLENSLDAKAKKIKIEIFKGGLKKILIQDNGIGIDKKDLFLSIKRHCTSKIFTLNDLKNINTLGFRGEALCSINSVSKIKIISKTKSQNIGWALYKEDNKNKFKIFPFLHSDGCTVEVLDLFYNYPVRRKFLKSESIEFNYIHDIVKNIALSRFDIEIHLYHNKKLVHFYSSKDNLNKEIRLKYIVGNKIFKNLLKVKNKTQNLKLSGWITNPINNHQIINLKKEYLYVNGRIINNKLLKKAIYQIYYKYNFFRNISYVLYLKTNPNEIDINIHPTKKDILFHNSRKIHDFVYESIKNNFENFKIYNFKKNHFYSKNIKNFLLKKKKKNKKISLKIDKDFIFFEKILIIIKERYVLVKSKNNKIFLISIYVLYSLIKKDFFNKKLHKSKTKLLLFPIRIKIKNIEKKNLHFFYELKSLGLHIQIEKKYIILFKISFLFTRCNLLKFFLDLVSLINKNKYINFSKIKIWIINYLIIQKKSWNNTEIKNLLFKFEKKHFLIKSPPPNLIKKIDFEIF